MNNLTQISDLIDIEIPNTHLSKTKKVIKSFNKMNPNITLVTDEPSIMDGNTIIRISVPRNDKTSWIRAIEAQLENENIKFEVLG